MTARVSLWPLLVLAVTLTAGAAAVPSGSGALERLEARWAQVHNFSVAIDTFEVLGERSESGTVRYTFRAPDRAKLEILSGPGSGGVIVWRGGSKVGVYKRGLSLLKIHMDARDSRVVSLRGNNVFTPNLHDVLACFSAHRPHVVEVPGRPFEGRATETIALNYAGFTCPGDSPADRAVTRDELVLSEDGTPILRERFEGSAVIERWRMHDVKINPALKDSDFR